MSKKNRSEKEAARLRREVEMLKAQLAAGRPNWNRAEKADDGQTAAGQPSAEKQPSYSSFRTTAVTDYSYLKGDLLKTAVLSAAALTSIFLIHFYQGKTDQVLKLLSPIFRR